MANILFLDIDGVLNTTAMVRGDTHSLDSVHLMSKKRVLMLNDFTEQTGCKIVISSTWRKRTLEATIDHLKPFGITGEIVGVTPKLSLAPRGLEIATWIDDHGVLFDINNNMKNTYVILDDDSDMLLNQANNFISVDPWVGITPQTLFKTAQILDLHPNYDNIMALWVDYV